MQNCISASPDNAPLTPNKRVAYAFGMVLGVTDFTQEQAHFEWKSRLANHLTDGCGTLCGIQITQAPVTDDVEIRLRPGYAISPRGHWLWVEMELCARLGAWIKNHLDPTKEKNLPDFTKPVSVYVRLCYSECPTDAVPIAANACASAEDSSAPSRILETVSADFSWNAPDLNDQIHIRAFAELLANVEIIPAGGAGDDTNAFLAAARNVVAAPAPGVVYRLPEATIRDTIHTGLTIWATETRPTIGEVKDAGGKATAECLPPESGDDCLLIGRLDFTWDAAMKVIIGGKVDIHQEKAPVLLDNKVLQEWLAALQANTIKYTDEAKGDVIGKFSDLKVVGLQKHPISAAAPTSEQALVWDGAAWAPQTAAGDATGAYNKLKVEKIQNIPVPATPPADGQILVGKGQKWILGDHGDLAGRTDDDHPQYLLASGARPLSGDWNVGGVKKITGLIKPTANGDAVRFDEAVLDGDPANDTVKNLGDLSGVYPFPTVARIQGKPISATAPQVGQALVWDGANWLPQAVAAPAPPVDVDAIIQRIIRMPVLPFANITTFFPSSQVAVLPGQIRMWFHFAPGDDNRWRLEKPNPTAKPLRIFAEIDSAGAPAFLQELTNITLQEVDRNVWAMPLTVLGQVNKNITRFRFVFDLRAMQVRNESDPAGTPFAARDMIVPNAQNSVFKDHPIHWEGFDGKNTVTVFMEFQHNAN